MSILKFLIYFSASNLCICAVMIAVVLGYWRFHNLSVLSVQSDSMAPTFRSGDSVLVDTTQVRDIKPGQVISFQSQYDKTVFISHRLISSDKSTGRYTTQGDGVNEADSPVSKDQIIGRVVGVLPGFGTALQLFRSPAGLAASVYLPCLLFLYHELSRAAQSWGGKTYRISPWKSQRPSLMVD